MGQILHGSAATTHAVRAAIQRSKAPLKELAARHGLNPKTVAKWLKRASCTARSWTSSPRSGAF
jgi:transposase-like protein